VNEYCIIPSPHVLYHHQLTCRSLQRISMLHVVYITTHYHVLKRKRSFHLPAHRACSVPRQVGGTCPVDTGQIERRSPHTGADKKTLQRAGQPTTLRFAHPDLSVQERVFLQAGQPGQRVDTRWARRGPLHRLQHACRAHSPGRRDGRGEVYARWLSVSRHRRQLRYGDCRLLSLDFAANDTKVVGQSIELTLQACNPAISVMKHNNAQ
jgi:hypothetical protein